MSWWHDSDDETLMAAYQGGEAGAFDVLVRHHQNQIYRFLLRLTRAQQLADEALVETFYKLHRAAVSWAGPYLSGSPMTAPEEGSALVYAYGNAVPIELAMEVDGQPRGSFPRTIPIEPGRMEVTLRRKDGSVRAKGMVTVTPGQVYSFGMLLDALEGYRRYFGLELGPAAQLAGPAGEVWGRQAFRLGVISGHRIRDGMFRGLTLGLTAGFNPGYGGVVADLTDRQWRSAFDVGARAVLRRQLGRFQGGVGWQSQLVYTPAVTETRGDLAYAEAQYLHSWLNLRCCGRHGTSTPICW